MRNGLTTGTCAAAAAKAATIALVHGKTVEHVEIRLPGGSTVNIPIVESSIHSDVSVASVRKDAGDDPDVTDKAIVRASVYYDSGNDVVIKGGEGIGLVTKPGLSVDMGKHAINPVPMSMIKNSVREVTDRGVTVIIEIPGGRILAEKTFNPRLGIVGGLSILGTSGIVKPFSCDAIRDTLKLAVRVAIASGITQPVLTPGRIGRRAVDRLFSLPEEQVIEVGNEWGFILERISCQDFDRILIVGHPGKLSKILMGYWDTHSKRSPSAAPYVIDMIASMFEEPGESFLTVEAALDSLTPERLEIFAASLAGRINETVKLKLGSRIEASTILINLKSEVIGCCGETRFWKAR